MHSLIKLTQKEFSAMVILVGKLGTCLSLGWLVIFSKHHRAHRCGLCLCLLFFSAYMIFWHQNSFLPDYNS